MTAAIVFVPIEPQRQRWVDFCLEYCVERGYSIAAVVFAANDALAMLVDDPKAVLVTARLDMLPRIEAVVDKRTPAVPLGTQRRPRRLRRAAA